MLKKIIKNKWSYLVVAAIASGLYAIFHTYGTNFQLTNSWSQLGMMLLFFIVLPITTFLLVTVVVTRIPFLKKYEQYSMPILNATFFTFFILGKSYGFTTIKILLVGFAGAILLAILLRKHYKKIIVIQLILAFVAFVKIPPMFYHYMTKSTDWLQQPDSIEQVRFKKQPNIYVIQPDGYVNFSELKNEVYNFNNSTFEAALKNKNFKLYNNYRSNYMSTLLSNSSMFAMKHHYIKGHENGGALNGLREIIVGENSTLSIFKNNQYKTTLLVEYPYLLMSRPTLAYDECNIKYSEVPWFGVGAFKKQYNIIEPLKQAIKNNTPTKNFYFIEKIAPSHITTTTSDEVNIERDREAYLEKLKNANEWLLEITDVIIENDPNSLIIISADHGGFVGLDYYAKIVEKQTKKDLVYSVFSSALAIKWPNGEAPMYDNELQSPVNLFRIVFAYLSENNNYLQYLEKDQSFSLIQKDAPYGVYEYIDDEGNVVFNKLEN